MWCNPYRPNRWLWGDMLTCWPRNDVHPLAMLSLLYGSSWTLLGSLVGLVASLLTWYIKVQRIYENWGEQNPVGEFSKWFRSPGPSAWRPFCFFAAWQKDGKDGGGGELNEGMEPTSRWAWSIMICLKRKYLLILVYWYAYLLSLRYNVSYTNNMINAVWTYSKCIIQQRYFV